MVHTSLQRVNKIFSCGNMASMPALHPPIMNAKPSCPWTEFTASWNLPPASSTLPVALTLQAKKFSLLRLTEICALSTKKIWLWTAGLSFMQNADTLSLCKAIKSSLPERRQSYALSALYLWNTAAPSPPSLTLGSTLPRGLRSLTQSASVRYRILRY